MRLKDDYLTKFLGILWLVAGLLQAQPNMFTTDFYAWYPPNIMESLIQGVADGQPTWLVHVIHEGSRLWSAAPTPANLFAIVIQLGIGTSLLLGSGRLMRATLWVSVVWGFMVWVMGEGLGGILSGGSYLDGIPGSALLLVIVALIELGVGRLNSTKGIRFLLVGYWAYAEIVQALPANGFWAGNALFSQFANVGALSQPNVLAFPILTLSELCLAHPFVCNLIVVLLLAAALGATWFDMKSPLYLVYSTVWLMATWWLGQDFGGVFSGLGTDLNTAPVVFLITLHGVRHARVAMEHNQTRNVSTPTLNEWGVQRRS